MRARITPFGCIGQRHSGLWRARRGGKRPFLKNHGPTKEANLRPTSWRSVPKPSLPFDPSPTSCLSSLSIWQGASHVGSGGASSGSTGELTNHPPWTQAAGFYFEAQRDAPDRCVCFACGNALTHWDVTDDPWVEHKTWYPQCPFIQGKATGNIPRKRGLVPKPPTPPAGGHDMSSGWGVGLVVDDKQPPHAPTCTPRGETGAGAAGLTSKLTKATSGLGSYIQQLQKMDPAAAAPSNHASSRPASVPKLFSSTLEPQTPPAVESVDIVFRGRQPSKQKKPEAGKKEAVSPASQVLLSMWESATNTSGQSPGSDGSKEEADGAQNRPSSTLRETSPDHPAESKPQQTVRLDPPL